MGEQAVSPTKLILWVLGACVAFVGVGLWLTQPRSDAEEWRSERDDHDDEVVRTYDTFEDAWKEVWKDGSRDGSGATEVAQAEKPKKNSAKNPEGRRAESAKEKRPAEEQETLPEADEATADSAPEASPLVATVESTSDAPDPQSEPAAILDSVVDPASADSTPTSVDVSLTNHVSTEQLGSTAQFGAGAESATTEIVEPVAKVSPRVRRSVDEETADLAQPVEPRVVTLRLSGSVGGKRLDRKDGYAFGRLAYFLQRERKPPYFLVYPDGGLSGVMGPPPAEGRTPGERKTVQGLPSLRPAGKLGAPLFVINLLAVVESDGAMTFYGRGVAQKYICRLTAQVVYMGGETPKVVDSFTVSENSTAMQGRGVAAGPPGGAIYQAAIEKLVERLRLTTYFR